MAEIRPEEQSEKAESCRENLWNEIQLKGPSRQKQTQQQNEKKKKRMGKLGWFPQHPHLVKVRPRGL